MYKILLILAFCATLALTFGAIWLLYFHPFDYSRKIGFMGLLVFGEMVLYFGAKLFR